MEGEPGGEAEAVGEGESGGEGESCGVTSVQIRGVIVVQAERR
jgi:hypothetical protein